MDPKTSNSTSLPDTVPRALIFVNWVNFMTLTSQKFTLWCNFLIFLKSVKTIFFRADLERTLTKTVKLVKKRSETDILPHKSPIWCSKVTKPSKMTKNRSKNGTHRVRKPSKSLFFDFRKKGAIGIDVFGQIGHFWQKDHFCTLSTPYNYPWYLIKVSKMSKNDHFDPRVDSDPLDSYRRSIWGFPLGCRLPPRLYPTELCIISWSEGQKWPKMVKNRQNRLFWHISWGITRLLDHGFHGFEVPKRVSRPLYLPM